MLPLVELPRAAANVEENDLRVAVDEPAAVHYLEHSALQNYGTVESSVCGLTSFLTSLCIRYVVLDSTANSQSQGNKSVIAYLEATRTRPIECIAHDVVVRLEHLELHLRAIFRVWAEHAVL